jgi:hypothetical protein
MLQKSALWIRGAQVEHLPRKHEALNSNPSTKEKKKEYKEILSVLQAHSGLSHLFSDASVILFKKKINGPQDGFNRAMKM